MSFIFHQLFFNPLYNLLVWLSAILPWQSLGLAIIVLTIFVKVVLLPLQHKTSKTQRKIRALEPKIKEVKSQYSSNKEEQARKIMGLYREHGINPLTSFWLLLIQIPIILALFLVFRDSFNIHSDLLYSFVVPPPSINPTLFGLDLTARNITLSLLVGISQFFQMRLAIPKLSTDSTTKSTSFKDDLAKSMNFQARYIMPAFIAIVSLGFPAALTLYWLTSNLFAIGHELWVKKEAETLVETKIEAKNQGTKD